MWIWSDILLYIFVYIYNKKKDISIKFYVAGKHFDILVFRSDSFRFNIWIIGFPKTKIYRSSRKNAGKKNIDICNVFFSWRFMYNSAPHVSARKLKSIKLTEYFTYFVLVLERSHMSKSQSFVLTYFQY